MIQTNKKISIAMTTYNGELYLREQINSLICQTHSFDELIIVDDGSIDTTIEIVNTYIKKYPDHNIILYQNENNLGWRQNFIHAIKLCQGDLIFIADQDDVWSENKIEIMTSLMIKNDMMCLVCKNRFMDKNNDIYANDEKFFKHLRYQLSYNDSAEVQKAKFPRCHFKHSLTGCTACIDRKVAELLIDNGQYSLAYDAQIGFYANCFDSNYILDQNLMIRRIHDNNSATANKETAINIHDKDRINSRNQQINAAYKWYDSMLNEEYQKKLPTSQKLLNLIKKNRKFYKKRLQYINEGNILGIISMLIYLPYYGNLKTYMGDLFYTMKSING